MTPEIRARLEVARKELLDLGLRNPLLNLRTRAKQITVVDERSSEIFRLLVQDGRRMSFAALADEHVKELFEGESEASGVDWDALLVQPDEERNGDSLAARHIDTRLQTAMSSEKLQSRLLSIHNDARTYLEEQGVNILFLALGFLYWYESSTSEEFHRAPLILIPVELTRSSAQERFHVSFTGEEVGDNLSLAEKLDVDFGITLPPIGSADDLDPGAYLASVENILPEESRWKVEADEIIIGFFSFGKFLMYNDLDLRAWSNGTGSSQHKILSALLGDGFRDPDSLYGDEDHIDKHVSPGEGRQVVDADSSQTLAILDVNAGRNMVLQGPPGTGKSQTITNIIAEAIGKGRKVLFVSEKMAALEVVKRRLDQVGLGDAVLELHSHKTKKKALLEELDRTLHQGRPLVEDTTDDVETLQRLRDRLNAYCEAVNAPIGQTRTTFINALGNALRTVDETPSSPLFPFHPMSDWRDGDHRAAHLLVDGLDRYLAEAGPPSSNPFQSSGLTELLPSQRPTLERSLKQAHSLTAQLIRGGAALAESMGLETPRTRKDVQVLCRAATRALQAPHLQGVHITAGEWQSQRDSLNRLIEAGRQLKLLHARFDSWLIDDAWTQDLLEVRQVYITLGKKWWRVLSGRFRRARARLQGLLRKPVPKGGEEALVIVDGVLDSQKHRTVYDEFAALGQMLFGVQWKRDQSDWDALAELTEWIGALYHDVGAGLIPSGIVNFLSGSPRVDQLKDQVTQLEDLLQHHAMAATEVSERLSLELKDDARDHWEITLTSQHELLSQWAAQLDALDNLMRYNRIAEDLRAHGLNFVLGPTRDWSRGRGSLISAFDHSWYSGLVERAYTESDALRLFDRTQQEQCLEEFSRLDRLLFEHNRAKLARAHWNTLPKLSSGGELAIISREINKRRRHLPIRKLMTEAGRAIQAIKPVFMMGPMSIATFLPPGTCEFDLVVFDEASQVKPVDGFGAILRGKQVVVVGDSKQLPPSRFFDVLNAGDEQEEAESVGDMESILSLFAGKGAPGRMLRWHYRSRHESLIAVSNNEFYENRLVVFPSPGVNLQARGLRVHHLAQTAYDRGRTRTNSEEAKKVAQAVMKHARDYPDLSLGVAAFSVAQRDAIEMQLELLRRQDPSCEAFFREDTREPFFIKNLENVQGDERDVIFISIGYGKTAEGYLAMSFGPLNADGGERRLNGLISRARLAMDVFTNFTADDLDLSRTQARGVVALRNFLAFAETGHLEQPKSTDREPDSPFEEAVIHALQAHGMEVEPQVGTAGFFIDVAVKDPEKPGRYLLGIECDGATYHSARSARDRDRLRQEVLEGLGWRIHRIWSTDWYRNPQRELERTLQAIQKAKDYWQLSTRPAATHREELGREVLRSKESSQLQQEKHGGTPYQQAKIRIPLGQHKLHELPVVELIPYIKSVVEVESPVHQAEVIKRITEGAGLQRAGRRIQTHLAEAIRGAERSRVVRQKEGFLWSPEMTTPTVRDRSQIAGKKLEWIAAAEITEALHAVIRDAYSLDSTEAVSLAAKQLGFSRLNAESRKHVEMVLGRLVRSGVIQKGENARLSIRT